MIAPTITALGNKGALGPLQLHPEDLKKNYLRERERKKDRDRFIVLLAYAFIC